MPDEPLPVGPVAAPPGFDAWYSGTAAQPKPSFNDWYGTPPAPPTSEQMIASAGLAHAVAGPAIQEALGHVGGLRNFNVAPDNPEYYPRLREAMGQTIEEATPQIPMPAAPEGVFRNIVAAPGRLVIGAANMVLGAPSFALKTGFNAGTYADELVEAHKAVKNAATRAEQVAAEDQLQTVNARALRAPYDLTVALGGILTREAEGFVPLTREMFDARGGWDAVLADLKGDPAGMLLPAAGVVSGVVFGGLKGGKAIYERKVDPQVFARAGASIEAIENQPITPKEWAVARHLSAIVADWDVNPSTHRWAERGLAKIAAGEGISDSFAKRAIEQGGPSFKKIWESAAPAKAAPVAPVQIAPPEVPPVQPGTPGYVPPPETLPPGVDQIVENFGNRLLQADTPTKAAAVWKIIENNVDKVPGLRDSRSYETLHDIYARKLGYWADEAKKAGKEPPAAEVVAPKVAEPAPVEAAPAAAEVAPAPVAEAPVPTAGEAPPIRAAMAEAAGVARVGQPGGGGVSVRESLKPPTEAPAAETLTADSILTDLAAGIKAEQASSPKGESALLKTLQAEDPVWAKAVQDVLAGAKPGDVRAGMLTPDVLAGMDRLGNMNLSRTDLTPGARAVLERIQNTYREAFKAREVPLTETADNARELIRSGQLTAEKILAMPDDLQVKNPAKHVAARNIEAGYLETAHETLKQLAQDYAAGKIDADAFQAGSYATILKTAAVSAKVRGMTAEAGRTLGSYRLIADASKESAGALRTMLQVLEKQGLTKEKMAEAITDFGKVDPTNIRQVNAWLQKFIPRRVADMIWEGFLSMLLSRPVTQLRNFLSNLTVLGVFRPAETAVAAAIRAPGRTIHEVPAQYAGMAAGWREGTRAFMQGWREELDSGTLLKFEDIQHSHAIPGKAGFWIRTPLRLLAACDQMFKAVIESSELYSLAMKRAVSEGLHGDARVARAGELVKDTGFILETLKARKDAALYGTFNQPFGPWGQNLNALRMKVPGLRYQIPFMRTLNNIAKYALERTPLNVGRLTYKGVKGQMPWNEVHGEMAKPIMGSILGAVVVKAVLDGYITGGGPKDQNKRQALQRTGWQPYSFVIGGHYVPFGWNEPVGSIAGMAADFAELLKENEDHPHDRKVTDYAEAISLSIGKNILSKTFVRGISDLLGAINDPARYGDQWMKNLAASVIPGAVAVVAGAADTTVRKADTPWDAIKARIPGLSQDLMPRRDAWGREIERPGGFFTRIGLTPGAITEATEDPVEKEVLRLGADVNVPGARIGVKGKKYMLTPIEFDVYQMESGQAAYEAVSRIASRSMPDEAKKKAIEKAVADAREVWRDRFKKANWLRMQEEAK